MVRLLVLVSGLFALLWLGTPALAQPAEVADPLEEEQSETERSELKPHTLLFEGRMGKETALELFRQPGGAILPNLFLPPGFRPRNPKNPFGLTERERGLLDKIEPEIRIHLTDDVMGSFAVERRGWFSESSGNRDRNCVLVFDYRVNVIDRDLNSTKTFGKIDRPYELVKVLTRQTEGMDGLYVLIVPTVQINTKKIGDNFKETHRAIASNRTAAGQTIEIASVPRWLVVEHELVHAEQIRKAYLKAWEALVKTPNLCNPNRPTNQNKARLEAQFKLDWDRLTQVGHAGAHDNAAYPNTPAETEARTAAWALWDSRTP